MTESLSSAIVDSSGLLKTLQGALQGGYRREEQLLTILDFLALAEGVVLNDKLVVVEAGLGFNSGNNRHSRSGTDDEDLGWHELIRPLEEAGIIDAKPVAIKAKRLPDQDARRSGVDQDAWFETGRIVAAEKELKIPALPMMRQRAVYQTFSNSTLHHCTTDLVGKYEDLKDALMEFRFHRELKGQFITLPIPPIGMKVLSRCENREDLVNGILELRDEYAALRKALRNLREDLADPHISPAKKSNLLAKWVKSWNTLATYDDHLSMIELANTTTGMLDSERELAANAAAAVTLNQEGLLSALMSRGIEAISAWRVRVLHQTAKHYLNTTDHTMAKRTESVFGVQLSRDAIESLNRATTPDGNKSGSRTGFPVRPPHHRTCGSAYGGSTKDSSPSPE